MKKKTTWVFFLHKGPEPLNVSIRRIRLNRRILLNKKIGVNSIYKVIDVYVYVGQIPLPLTDGPSVKCV